MKKYIIICCSIVLTFILIGIFTLHKFEYTVKEKDFVSVNVALINQMYVTEDLDTAKKIADYLNSILYYPASAHRKKMLCKSPDGRVVFNYCDNEGKKYYEYYYFYFDCAYVPGGNKLYSMFTNISSIAKKLEDIRTQGIVRDH